MQVLSKWLSNGKLTHEKTREMDMKMAAWLARAAAPVATAPAAAGPAAAAPAAAAPIAAEPSAFHDGIS